MTGKEFPVSPFCTSYRPSGRKARPSSRRATRPSSQAHAHIQTRTRSRRTIHYINTRQSHTRTCVCVCTCVGFHIEEIHALVDVSFLFFIKFSGIRRQPAIRPRGSVNAAVPVARTRTYSTHPTVRGVRVPVTRHL